MNKQTVMVTGSAGYIGEELVKNLYSTGHSVIQVDQEFGTRVEDMFPDSIKLLQATDIIVHLAAISGIKACHDDPIEAAISNVIGPMQLMTYAANSNKAMIIASSAAAKNPNSSVYAMGKFLLEQHAKWLNDNHDGIILPLRFSNVYGGENYVERKTSVIAKFISQAKNGNPVTMYDGSQTRDFIHVDMICGFIACLIEMQDHEWFKYFPGLVPVDVCTGVQTSIYDLAMMFPSQHLSGALDGIGTRSAISDPTNMEKVFKSCKDPKETLREYIKSQLGVVPINREVSAAPRGL